MEEKYNLIFNLNGTVTCCDGSDNILYSWEMLRICANNEIIWKHRYHNWFWKLNNSDFIQFEKAYMELKKKEKIKQREEKLKRILNGT